MPNAEQAAEQQTTQEQKIADKYKPNNNFCNELKNLRVRENLSQTQFAERLHVSLTSVQNWENGRCFPNDSTCVEIISFFDLTEEETSLLFIKQKKEEPLNIMAAENEAAISDSVPKAKPLIVIFKEQWLKVRKPFVIGVLAWLVICIAFAACFIAVYTDNRRITANASTQIKIIITSPTELILFAIILFIVTVGVSVLIYFIIRKVRKK